MRFITYGEFEFPFEITTSGVKRVKLDKRFWEEIEDVEEGLAYAVGCYLFAWKAGPGYTPWYVGQANRQPFHKECSSNHKKLIYNEVCANKKRGKPVIFFFARVTNTDRFSRTSSSKSGHSDIRFLETMLIGLALRANKNLLNVKDTKFLREMQVPGILNSPKGPLSGPERAVRRCLSMA